MKKILALLLMLCAASAAFAAMGDEEFVDLCGKEGSAPQLLAALNDGANPNAKKAVAPRSARRASTPATRA